VLLHVQGTTMRMMKAMKGGPELVAEERQSVDEVDGPEEQLQREVHEGEREVEQEGLEAMMLDLLRERESKPLKVISPGEVADVSLGRE
jgi:hypothetical protein